MPVSNGKGRVTARFGADFQIATSDDTTITATGRNKHRDGVCGDFVNWEEESAHSYAITELLPRKNALSRSGFRNQSKVLAANIDQVIIVTAANPLPDWELVDQLLCVSEKLDTDTVILHHKNDLTADQTMLDEWGYFKKMGYAVLETSINDLNSMHHLEKTLAAKTNILVGQSGVGKSSLARILLKNTDIKVGEVSQVTQFGQHTTSVTVLYDLPAGGYLIDSPGVRDFTPDNLSQEDIHYGFSEIHQLASQCRFHNCQHINEPQCAVKAALNNREISERRYNSYLKLTGSPD